MDDDLWIISLMDGIDFANILSALSLAFNFHFTNIYQNCNFRVVDLAPLQHFWSKLCAVKSFVNFYYKSFEIKIIDTIASLLKKKLLTKIQT